MALKTCKECGKEISDTIKNCNHCGYKQNEGFSKSQKIIMVVLSVLIIVSLGVLGVLGYTLLNNGRSVNNNNAVIDTTDTVDYKSFKSDVYQLADMLDKQVYNLKDLQRFVYLTWKDYVEGNNNLATSLYMNEPTVKSAITKMLNDMGNAQDVVNNVDEVLELFESINAIEVSEEYEALKVAILQYFMAYDLMFTNVFDATGSASSYIEYLLVKDFAETEIENAKVEYENALSQLSYQ